MSESENNCNLTSLDPRTKIYDAYLYAHEVCILYAYIFEISHSYNWFYRKPIGHCNNLGSESDLLNKLLMSHNIIIRYPSLTK